MELPASHSSHQFNVRKAGEPGLAEWAQKIRSLQRQVDDDEEEEHRKLEQEIAASRLARVRRSAAYGRSSPDPATDIPSPTSRRFDAPEFAKSSTVHRGEQTELLQKPISKPSPRPQTAPSSPASKSHATSIESRNIKSSSVPQPVFGQGSMAMLDLSSRRRVASPIQDHESYSPMPTTSTRIHSPLTKHEFNREPTPIMKNDLRSGVDASRQPLTSTPSTALKRYMDRVEQVTSTQSNKTSFERDVPRPRTMSTPNGTHPTHATARPSPRPASPRARIPPRSPNFDAHRTPPAFDSDFPLSKSPSLPSSKSSTTAFMTPTKSATPSSSSPIFGVKLSTFSTSTPESSKPKATPLTPQHRTPSLHPPKEKDPTPSISRLKGRGFVQSMVKASSALEAAATSSTKPEVGKFSPSKHSSPVASRWKPESPQPSPSQPAAKPISANFRKSWTPSAASTPSMQKTAAQRKSWTTSEPLKIEESERERPVRASDQQSANRSVRVVESHHTGRSGHAVEHQQTGQSVRVPGAEHTERSIHKAPSLPSLSTPSRPSTPPPASPGGHGIGSSSTMFSYIKPMKTGDDHATGHPHPHSRPTTPKHVSAGGMASAQDADELGHRTEVGLNGQRQRDGVTGFPAPSGRPLVHLTKGRPKPKRANRKNTGEWLSETSTSTLASSPRVPTPGPPVKSAIAQAVMPTPTSSRSPITPPPTRAVGATSHTDVPTQLRSHQLTSQTDRPSANTTDPWDEQTPMVVRSSDPAGPTTPNLQGKPFLVGIARPLPSLSTPSSSPTKPSQARPPSASPRSPRRQSRIPSTGSRTLVMDVAQTFQEAQAVTTEAEFAAQSPIPSAAPRQAELSALPIEKRKSGFDKYSGHVIPSRAEEGLAIGQGSKPELNMQKEVKIDSDVRGREHTYPDNLSPVQQDTRFIEIPYKDEPLPRVDLDKLILPSSVYQPNADFTTISVDVLSVTCAAATDLKNDTDVFYDSEILAIVRRVKLKSSNLVETTLWGWQGRRSQIGEREQRKLKDMARHYGTKLFPVQQGCEPSELVHALGGRLATRQGTRSYWSAENTTMHQVRLVHGNVFIDELEFNVSNLCSAFSYCLTLLGSCYVWHGKGSLSGERQAALGYALSLAVESSPVELVEQESDDNEMFWMMLGNDDYARADYWKWRPDLATALPRIWRVDSSSAPYLTTVQTFTTQSNFDLSVFLLDCIWELFVIVGTKARKARRDIRLALSTARGLSSLNAVRRPFTPPIHVLILPSKIPLDLRLHFRDLDEERVNGTYQPDHMNLLELSEALFDLERVIWEKSRLKDPTMLPLGIDPTCLPQSLTVDKTPIPVPR